VRVGLWNHIRLVAGDRPIPVFCAVPVLYNIAESPLESLLNSLLESLFKSLLESFLESVASGGVEFSMGYIGQWRTLSYWILWLTGSKSVDALTLTLT